MESRKRDGERKPVTPEVADKLFLSNDFCHAFDCYKKILVRTANPGLSVYCRAKMLLCQWSIKGISWGEVIIRSTSLIDELTAIISVATTQKNIFELCLEDMKLLRESLAPREKKKAYIYSSAKLLIKKIESDSLYKYENIMEMAPFGHDKVATRLSALYQELANSRKKGALAGEVAEKAAEAYRDWAGEIDDDLQAKKHHYLLAKEKVEQALSHWKGLSLVEEAELQYTLLNIVERLYELALVEKNETDRAQSLVAFHSVLSCTAIVKLAAKQKRDETEEALHEDIEEYQAWFQEIIGQASNQDVILIKLLRERAKKLPPSNRDWQASLDRLIMLPPPPKKRRLGADIFSVERSYSDDEPKGQPPTMYSGSS